MRFFRSLGCLLCLAFAAWAATASAQDAQQSRIIDRDPFDRITLDKANDNKVYLVKPIPFPDRRVPENPKQSEKLRIKPIGEDQEYDVAWLNIDRVELYEEMVLAEALGLTRQGKFDEAYDYFVFLLNNYPKTKDLAQGHHEYLYLSSGAAFRQQKYDEALALIEELLSLNPEYRAASGGPTLLTVLGNIADKMIAAYVEKSDYRSARTLLSRLSQQHKAENEPFVTRWRTQFVEMATAHRDRAREHLEAGRFVEALDESSAMMNVWPELPGAGDLAAEIARRYPLIRVGVSQPASEFDSRSVLNPAARRAGRLVERRLLEFSGPGPEGGRYQSPLGTLERSDDGMQLSFTLRTAAGAQPLSGYELAQKLLDWSRPGSTGYEPSWQRLLGEARIAGVNKVVIELRAPHVLPEALLQQRLMDNVLAGEINVKGNGPYYCLTRDAAAARFTSNDQYTLPRPGRVAEVLERRYDDPQRALLALKRGEVDVIDQVFPADIEALRSDANLAVAAYAAPTTHVIIFKEGHPYLANRTFRRALVYGSHRQQVVEEGLLKGKSLAGFQVVSAPFPAPTPGIDSPAYGYDQQIAARPYDPRLAIALRILSQTEVKATFEKQQQKAPALSPITLGHPADETSRIACRALQKQWKTIGVECKLVEFAPGVFDDRDSKCDAIYCQIATWEPVVDAARLLGPEGVSPAKNAFIQLALRQIERAANWQEARERFRELHRLLHEDVTVLPLWQTFDHYAYRKSLTGLAGGRVTLYQDVEQWQVTPQLAGNQP